MGIKDILPVGYSNSIKWGNNCLLHTIKYYKFEQNEKRSLSLANVCRFLWL